MELGPFGITSNTIHPGAVAGDRINRVLQGRAEATGATLGEVTRQGAANQSVQRLIDPGDIAALVLFLTGPHGRTISGQDDSDRRRFQIHPMTERRAIEDAAAWLSRDGATSFLPGSCNPVDG